MSMRLVLPVALLMLCAGVALGSPAERQRREKGGPQQPTQNSTCNDVPAHPVDLILARPTRTSVTLSVLAYQDITERLRQLHAAFWAPVQQLIVAPNYPAPTWQQPPPGAS